MELTLVTHEPGQRNRPRGTQPTDDPHDWTQEDVLSLKALGWVLPAIVSGLREDSDSSATNGSGADDDVSQISYARVDLDQLVDLALTGRQHDIEASLAQGFKGDAMRHATDPGGRTSGPGSVASHRRAVARCLRGANFWYARMVFHQALGLYAIAASDPTDTLDVYAALLRPGGEPHPFTQRAARLARRGVERHQIGSRRWEGMWQGMIWKDEGEVVGRRPTVLTYKAAQLVGDVTLLLNLNELSGEDHQVEFGFMSVLPHCLSESPNRREILGAGCPRECGWNFCPYKQPPPDEPNAHRGVSRAFCRHQMQVARRRIPAWQRKINLRTLVDFWREMERRARN
jgi:hypothetical protein